MEMQREVSWELPEHETFYMEEEACSLGVHLTSLTATSLIIWRMMQKAEWRWEETESPRDLHKLMNKPSMKLVLPLAFLVM